MPTPKIAGTIISNYSNYKNIWWDKTIFPSYSKSADVINSNNSYSKNSWCNKNLIPTRKKNCLMYVVSNCSNKDNMLKKLHKKYAADRVGILLLSHYALLAQAVKWWIVINFLVHISTCTS